MNEVGEIRVRILEHGKWCRSKRRVADLGFVYAVNELQRRVARRRSMRIEIEALRQSIADRFGIEMALTGEMCSGFDELGNPTE